jgi:hypothetical protein
MLEFTVHYRTVSVRQRVIVMVTDKSGILTLLYRAGPEAVERK